MPDFLFWNQVVIPLAGMALTVVLGWPLAKAIARRIEHRSSSAGSDVTDRLKGELDELRRRVEAVEDLSGRMGEIEDRLEFAERLLTRQRESGHLPS